MIAKWLAGLIALLVCSVGPAHAQASHAIPVTDPDSYSLSLANQIARDQMEPIRDVFTLMAGGGAIDVQAEASLTAYDRFLAGQRIDRFTELEDTTLAGVLRRIYYMHSFNGRFLFTRMDFIQGSDGWMLTGLTFGSTWASVATPSSPSWTPAQ